VDPEAQRPRDRLGARPAGGERVRASAGGAPLGRRAFLGLVLGGTIDEALGDRKRIVRYASVTVPMDECLVAVSVDLGGRPYFVHDLRPKARIVGSFDSTLVPDFFVAFAQAARCTIHVSQLRGGNTHHLLEATFKALGRALDAASQRDARRAGVPSSKGRIG